MKIRAEVTAVETNGEKLVVRLQGLASSDPAWLSMNRYTIETYASKKAQRSYYVGRPVEISVTPR